ncbi:hypothetical protein B0H67DRAFT_391182 [Lasiosphaeris hirsuta]|uniref:Uncharacterized protein n=1 Tax=Lasiosphaeris hirsuta TaxID=260670 RepID=A0AA39ZSA4_9PEZI|nr:hypothetical protein B0H67DRAFT_391182 [Lasiosphaeris hirsuta]
MCPVSQCDGGPFDDPKGLQRHYETHVECDENCDFCGTPLTLVSKLRRHYCECPSARKVKASSKTVQSRRGLYKSARTELDKLLQTDVTRAGLMNIPNSLGKRRRELETDGPQQKQGRLQGDDGIASVRYEHFQGDSAVADSYAPPSAWRSFPGSLTAHPELTMLVGNSPFQSTERNFGRRGDDDAEALFPSNNPHTVYAPPSDSMDCNRIATQGSLVSATSLSRAPTLSVHTVDGLGFSAAYAAMQAPVPRAPALCVYTADGITSHQPVGGYFSTPHKEFAADHITYNHGAGSS